MGALQTTISSVSPPVGALNFRPDAKLVELRPIQSEPPRPADSDAAITASSTGAEQVPGAIAGDSAYWDNLCATYSSRLYRTAFAILHNKEDAEDAVQDGLCNAYRKRHYFQGRSSIATWLTRIVVNSALMSRRKNNAHPGTSLDEMLASRRSQIARQIVDRRPNPEKICDANEVRGLVEREIRKLPLDVQMAVQLHEIEGFSAEESIQSLGIPRSTFKSRILRARRKLKAAFQQPQASDTLMSSCVSVVRSNAGVAGVRLFRARGAQACAGDGSHRQPESQKRSSLSTNTKGRNSNARSNQAAQ